MKLSAIKAKEWRAEMRSCAMKYRALIHPDSAGYVGYTFTERMEMAAFNLHHAIQRRIFAQHEEAR